MVDEIYILIVTYNSMTWLPKALASLPSEYKTIIVDNNSKDETVNYVKEKYPNIILFQQNQNLGFGGGNNLGIKYALKNNAEYIFLLNQDAYLMDNTIKKLIEVHQSNPEYGVLSPVHLNGTGTKFDRNFSYYLDYDKNEDFYFDALHKNLKTVYDVPFVNAAAWLLPKKTIELIGYFDPIFFHYGEDVNYCQRVVYNKLKIGVVPNSFVKHDRLGSKIKEGKQFTAEYYKNIERRLKMQWADINKDDKIIHSQFEAKIKSLNKKRLKSQLKLKFKTSSNLKQEKALLVKIYNEVQSSRTINKKKKIE